MAWPSTFFNVSGGLYVDAQTNTAQRSSAQGLFMLMTNGIGASLGTIIAGSCVVNKLVFAPGLDATDQLDGWRTSWFIFAAYALVVGVLFMLIFKERKTSGKTPGQAAGNTDAGGMIEKRPMIRFYAPDIAIDATLDPPRAHTPCACYGSA